METFNRDSRIFELLTEAVSEGIVVINSRQEIVSTNSSLNEMFGYEKGELIGQKLDILIPTRFKSRHSTHVSGFMTDSEKRQMGQGRHLYGCMKDGTEFPVEAGLSPFEIYGERYVMALVIDITIRKEQEEEIRQLNTRLEEKIKDRTRELEKSVERLSAEIERRKEAENKMQESLQKERELNELKTKFLSLVSHEFKTPLSGIHSSATLVGKYTLSEQQDKREKHINTIQNKVKYLNNILDDFLSIERLETGVDRVSSDFPFTIVAARVGGVIDRHLRVLSASERMSCCRQ